MEDKAKLLSYLKSFDLLVLATQGESPNAATVYYGIDDNFDIYIVTPPSTEHGKNISLNSSVACVVVDTGQKMLENQTKIGVQIQGQVRELKDKTEMQKALEIWSKGKSDVAEKFLEDISSGKKVSRPYKITPSEIKWFNEELYGEEGTKIFNFDF